MRFIAFDAGFGGVFGWLYWRRLSATLFPSSTYSIQQVELPSFIPSCLYILIVYSISSVGLSIVLSNTLYYSYLILSDLTSIRWTLVSILSMFLLMRWRLYIMNTSPPIVMNVNRTERMMKMVFILFIPSADCLGIVWASVLHYLPISFRCPSFLLVADYPIDSDRSQGRDK